jgi:phage FluMu protein Com
VKDLDIRCRKCGRFLGLKGIHSVIAQVRCSNSKCKALNNIKIVTPQSQRQQEPMLILPTSTMQTD